MYAKYLEYIKDPKNISNAEEDYQEQCKYVSHINKKEFIDRYLFENFLNEHSDDTFNIETCILVDFPRSLLVKHMQKFVTHSYHMGCGKPLKEFLKYFYNIYDEFKNQSWKNHSKNYPDNLIYNCFEDLHTFTQNILTKNSLRDITCPVIPHDRYKCWNLLGLIPLIDDNPESIKHICKFYLNDAQDSLMFGLAQYDINFVPHLKDILKFWRENQNVDLTCSGTGIFADLKRLFDEYKRKGYNLYEDKEIAEILKITRKEKTRFYGTDIVDEIESHYNVLDIIQDTNRFLGISTFN